MSFFEQFVQYVRKQKPSDELLSNCNDTRALAIVVDIQGVIVLIEVQIDKWHGLVREGHILESAWDTISDSGQSECFSLLPSLAENRASYNKRFQGACDDLERSIERLHMSIKDLKGRLAELRQSLKDECLVRDKGGVVAIDSVKNTMLVSEYLESWGTFPGVGSSNGRNMYSVE